MVQSLYDVKIGESLNIEKRTSTRGALIKLCCDGRSATYSTNLTHGIKHCALIDRRSRLNNAYTTFLAGEQQQGETGGAPLEIEHAIHLCSDPAIGRSDEGFTGRLLELALWDEALTPETVAFFYQQVYFLGNRAGHPEPHYQSSPFMLIEATKPTKTLF